MFGSGAVWNESFGDKQYSARKDVMSMTASFSLVLVCRIQLLNIQIEVILPVTVIAYKGTVGSTQIKVMTVLSLLREIWIRVVVKFNELLKKRMSAFRVCLKSEAERKETNVNCTGLIAKSMSYTKT